MLGGVKRTLATEGAGRNPQLTPRFKPPHGLRRPLYRCCGTRIPSLHNLRLFLFPHAEARSRSLTTFARLYFLSDPRSSTHLTPTYDQITQASSILSCGAAQVPDRISERANLLRSALLISHHSWSRSWRRSFSLQQLERMKRRHRRMFTGTMTPWRSSLLSPQKVHQALYRLRTRLKTVPCCIYFLTHFTNSYEHDTGARLWTRRRPCEGSGGDPLRVRGGGEGPR
jgi:hypothetical protein